MELRVLFILLTTIFFFVINPNCLLAQETDESGDLKYIVYHKLFNQPTYSERGVLVLTPSRKVTKYSSSIGTLSIQDFANGTHLDSFYQIKIVNEQNPQKVLKSFTKACLLEASNFEDEIVVHLDKHNTIHHFDYYTSIGHCNSTTVLQFVNFKTTVHTIKSVNGASPKLTRALPLKEDGTVEKPPEEKSFLQKYWWYLIPILILLSTSGAPEEGQQRGRGGQGQQAHMVHESLRLYATNDSYTLIPYYLDPKIAAQTLVINRETGNFVLDNASFEPTSPSFHANALTVYGIFGVIRLLSGEYLIVITGRDRIGRLGGHDIFQANQFRILPFARNNLQLSAQQASTMQDEQHYLLLVENLLKTGTYYFSYTYDLTHTLQRQSQLEDKTSLPLWQRADERFFWNRYLQSKLIQTTLNNPDQNLSDFILPVVFGFVSISATRINNRDILFCLITRRSRHRAGTRYFSRGIDEEGNVSNYNETEQMILLDPIKDGHMGMSFEGKIKLSYVQTRGSVPIYWAQVKDMKYNPKLQIMDLPNTNESIRRHFDEQIRFYGNQICVNLTNKKGYEYPVGEAYDGAVKQLDDDRILYYHFDFHHECRNMQWERIQRLIDQIEEDLIRQEYFYSEELNGLNIRKRQKSVVRTNCMDCLDRTNVVQSTFAKWMLTQQLREVGVLSNRERIDENINFMDLFRNVWADNADAVSFSYSGTGALKTDFTRTGKRTFQGNMADFKNSVIRYVTNTFKDGDRQDAFDLLLGNYEVGVNIYTSPFLDNRSSLTKLAPQMLFACIALLEFLFLIPKSEGYSYIVGILMLFTTFVIISLLRYIFDHGDEFINWPRLIPQKYRFYKNTTTPRKQTKSTQRHSDSEYGEKIELQKIE
ncbi:10094_t:CDS:10 [Acaulospora morrowiae]|uniref:10094_t:CDS:1 n=1 Tax=Acaulospora morrowiae TaxID=94023 RepID=A0A9N9ACR8_9GLOM|nr:10094_t:CDS:10 [Acaulospora morrowiae]